MKRWLTTIVVGTALGALLPLTAAATTTLPDIRAELAPAFHLQLRTTTTASGVVDGVNLGLGLTPPAITSTEHALPTALDVALGRHDGRSNPRRPPRRPPSPTPRYHGTAWIPVALVLALVIVITCPTFVVLYY